MTDTVDSSTSDREGDPAARTPSRSRPRQTGPVRTCVGCRQRSAAADLLRVVAASDGGLTVLVPDPRHREGGRGAHLHPRSECIDLAERRKAFPRALRVPGPTDLSVVRQWVAAQAAGS